MPQTLNSRYHQSICWRLDGSLVLVVYPCLRANSGPGSHGQFCVLLGIAVMQYTMCAKSDFRKIHACSGQLMSFHQGTYIIMSANQFTASNLSVNANTIRTGRVLMISSIASSGSQCRGSCGIMVWWCKGHNALTKCHSSCPIIYLYTDKSITE